MADKLGVTLGQRILGQKSLREGRQGRDGEYGKGRDLGHLSQGSSLSFLLLSGRKAL